MKILQYRIASNTPRPLTLVDNEPPSEFLLWPLGETRFRWADGSEHSLTLTPDLAERLMSRFAETGRELAIDYNHGSLTSAAPDEAKAAGWFSLELREDGLWAAGVTWTEAAAAYLRAREYRYQSPTWAEEDGQPLELANIALTNNPATLGALPLVASNRLNLTAPAVETPSSVGAGEERTVRIASLLGLPESAGEPEVATRAAALRAFETEVLEQLDAEDRESAVGSLQALRATAAQAQPLAERVEALEAAAQETQREQLIAAAVREGRLTTAQAAADGWARTTPLATLTAFLASAPRVVPVGEVSDEAGTEPAEETPAENLNSSIRRMARRFTSARNN